MLIVLLALVGCDDAEPEPAPAATVNFDEAPCSTAPPSLDLTLPAGAAVLQVLECDTEEGSCHPSARVSWTWWPESGRVYVGCDTDDPTAVVRVEWLETQ